MTTKEEILKLAEECGDWNGQTIEMNDVGIEAFYHAARKPLEEENQRLQQQLAEFKAGQDTYQQLYNQKFTDLAAAQAREQQYREAMSEVEQKYRALLKEKDAEAEIFKAEGDMFGWNFHTGVRSGAVEMHLYLTKLIKALAQPTDTTALEAIAEKAGEVMRRKCAKQVELRQGTKFGSPLEDAIRALPGVTLADLKGSE